MPFLFPPHRGAGQRLPPDARPDARPRAQAADSRTDMDTSKSPSKAGENVERLRVPEKRVLVTPAVEAQLNERQKAMVAILVRERL